MKNIRRGPFIIMNLLLFIMMGFSVISYAGTQEITPIPNEIAVSQGQSVHISLSYDVIEGAKKTTGLGLRIYYNSSLIEQVLFEDVYGEGLLAVDTTGQDDASDSDNDALTDKYIGVAWVGVAGDWPSFMKFPVTLGKVVIKARTGVSGQTELNLLPSGTPDGYTLQKKSVAVKIR